MIRVLLAALAALTPLWLASALRGPRHDRARTRRTLRRLEEQHLSLPEMARSTGLAQDAVRVALSLEDRGTPLERIGSIFRRPATHLRSVLTDADAAKALWL